MSQQADEQRPVGSQRRICRSAWDSIPNQGTERPFCHMVWEAFMPVDPPSVEPGQMTLMPDPKLGKARCVFDGRVIACNTTSTRLVDLFLGSGRPNEKRKAQITRPLPRSEYWPLAAEFDQFVSELREQRAERQHEADKKKESVAKQNAAEKESNAAATAHQGSAAKRLKISHFYQSQGDKSFSFWQSRIESDITRFFLGDAVPDAKVESALFKQLLRTAFEAGQAGYSLADDGHGRKPPVKITLPCRHELEVIC
eukprot:m.12601 g.12601  ORF g.12601 m.12601 type:complete len:255 (+) comp4563_c0_seq2:32-796(+)